MRRGLRRGLRRDGEPEYGLLPHNQLPWYRHGNQPLDNIDNGSDRPARLGEPDGPAGPAGPVRPRRPRRPRGPRGPDGPDRLGGPGELGRPDGPGGLREFMDGPASSEFERQSQLFGQRQAEAEAEKFQARQIAAQAGTLKAVFPSIGQMKERSRAKQREFMEEVSGLFDAQIAKSGKICPRYLRYQTRFPPLFAAVKSRKDLSRYLTSSLRKVKSAYLLPAYETKPLFF